MSKKTEETVPVDVAGLVAEGVMIRAKIETTREMIADHLEEIKPLEIGLSKLRAELAEVEAKLIALGKGKYEDGAGHVASVSLGFASTQQPDSFVLRSKQDEEKARELAGDHFSRLFERHVSYAPRHGFDALAASYLTASPARKLIELCLVPGKLTGGRRASVAWKS